MWKINITFNNRRIRRKNNRKKFFRKQRNNRNTTRNRIYVTKDCLLEWRNILSNTMFGLEIKGIKNKENQKYVENLLKKYDLYEFRNKYPSELSGGMRAKGGINKNISNKT